MLRILFLALEFVDPIFSGNGVYGRTLVRALLSSKGSGFADSVHVLVVSGEPQGRRVHAGERHDELARSLGEGESAKVDIRTVTVPKWYKLDREAPWEEFGRGVSALSSVVAEFNADVVIGVDWTSCMPYETLKSTGGLAPSVPLVYMNFRVHFDSQDVSESDAEFFAAAEANILRHAVCTAALCERDAATLQNLAAHEEDSCRSFRVIAPPIRAEMMRIAQASAARNSAQKRDVFACSIIAEKGKETRRGGVMRNGEKRSHRGEHLCTDKKYLTCIARICPEKNVMAFVRAACKLAPFLKKRGIIPCIVGAKTNEGYSNSCLTSLKRAFPRDESIVLDFVDPTKLARIFQQTILNVHPALYEAYGMTIAEAALFGVPSLIDGSGGIGAADVFTPPALAIATSFASNGAATAAIKSLLHFEKRGVLAAIGNAAKAAALNCGEKALSDRLNGTIKCVLQNAFRAAPLVPKARPPKTFRRASSGELLADLNPSIWIEMLEWASEDLDTGKVMSYDLRLFKKHLCKHLLHLDPYKLAARILQCLDATVGVLLDDGGKIDVEPALRKLRKSFRGRELTRRQMKWAAFFLDMPPPAKPTPYIVREKKSKLKQQRFQRQQSEGVAGCVSKTRYSLVPARVTEQGFWSLLINGLVKEESVAYLRGV